MTHLAFTLPTSFPGLSGERKTHFHLFDSTSELADYAAASLITNPPSKYGLDQWAGMDNEEAVKVFREGDLSGVAASEALMSRFENSVVPTHKPAWANDVAGVFPDVPAFIAGHPLSMRRRVRRQSEGAPIAIVVDIGAAAMIEKESILRRGAAVLALVRILSARRPVELWVGSILDADGVQNSSAHFARVDTAPLDLARAAHILTDERAIRGTLWACARKHGFEARHPYGHGQAHSAHTATILAPAFRHVTDTIFLGRINHYDESIQNPEAWIERQLALALPEDGRETPPVTVAKPVPVEQPRRRRRRF